MSRECRKCGSVIPNYSEINGKKVTLQNRKFCLKCSPYGKHNTSPNDPLERIPRNWLNCSKERKELYKMTLYRRALQRRKNLYDQKGGKCQKCGYSKCARALSFHHRNPYEKKFGLTLNNLWSKNINEINQEAEKCDLLCSNCHAEVEDAKARETSIVKKINEIYGTNY